MKYKITEKEIKESLSDISSITDKDYNQMLIDYKILKKMRTTLESERSAGITEINSKINSEKEDWNKKHKELFVLFSNKELEHKQIIDKKTQADKMIARAELVEDKQNQLVKAGLPRIQDSVIMLMDEKDWELYISQEIEIQKLKSDLIVVSKKVNSEFEENTKRNMINISEETFRRIMTENRVQIEKQEGIIKDIKELKNK